MKRLVLASLFLLMSPLFAEPAPQLVPITTVDGTQVWVTKTVLKETYNAVFGVPAPVQPPTLSPAELAAKAQQIRQAAYAWAYSSSGMNVSQSEAQAFALDMSSRYNPEEAFNAYKLAYTFLYSSGGANLSQSESRQVAQRLSNLETPVDFVKVFKNAFTYAYSSGGMNLSQSDALKYALKSVGLN